MNTLREIGAFFRRERLTGLLALLIVAIIAVSILMRANVPSEPLTGNSAQDSSAQTSQEIKQMGEQMMEEIRTDKRLALKLGFIFFLVISVGLFVDVLFVCAIRERKFAGAFTGLGSPVPWSVGDVFKTFVALFFSEILIAVVLALWAAMLGVPFMESTLLLMGGTMMRNVVVALFVLWLVMRRYGAGFKDLGFRLSGFFKSIGTGIAAYFGFFPLYLVLLLIIMGILKLAGYEPPLQSVVEVVYKEKNVRALVVASLVISLLGPFFEEMFFRGFMYQAFRRKWGVTAAVIWVSVIFAAMHAHWVAFLPIFALSAVLCLLFEKTGTLFPGIALHVFHNCVTLVLMFQVKGFAGG